MRKTVFLSSTGKDLSAYRRQVIEDARGHDWFHIDAMEEFGARIAGAVQFCQRRVEASDIFVGLVGFYRGWEPAGDDRQRSITEMEYDWASAASKPMLTFLAPEGFSPESATDDPGEAARQEGFRRRLLAASDEHISDLKAFGSSHTLATAVFRALTNQVFYDLAAQAPAATAALPATPNPTAAAADALAQVAQDENLDPAEMQAQGFGLDEIEAALLKRAQAAKERVAAHKEAEAKDRKEGALYWKRLGALAFLYDTAKALQAYAEAAALDPEDWEALWYLGQLQMRGGQLLSAKQSFERLIEREGSLDHPRFIHWSYFLLGDVETGLGNRLIALSQYERGQALVKALNERDPNNAEWQRDLSVSYNKIGDISAARGDRDGALKAFNDGLDIRKRLAARDPNNAEWQRDLSVSYNKIGDISAARGDRDGALKAFNDGLDIAKRLAARDPNNAEWQRDLSVSYNKIGDISAARGDRDGALKAFNDGLDIAKRLAARDPNNVVWQTDLAVSAWKLASVDDVNAPKHLAEGLAIMARLKADNKLTADQEGWLGTFEAALNAPGKGDDGVSRDVQPVAKRKGFFRRLFQ